MKRKAPKEPPAKRQYDSAESKRRLVRAAIEEFAKAGYERATTRGIAHRARVNEALIHRYFTNKEGLFLCLLKEYHRQIVMMPDYPAGETFREEMENFLSFRIEFGQRNAKFMRLIMNRTMMDPKLRKKWGTLSPGGTPGLQKRLEALQAKGRLPKKIVPADLSLALTGFAFAMVMFSEILGSVNRAETAKAASLASHLLAKALD